MRMRSASLRLLSFECLLLRSLSCFEHACVDECVRPLAYLGAASSLFWSWLFHIRVVMFPGALIMRLWSPSRQCLCCESCKKLLQRWVC